MTVLSKTFKRGKSAIEPTRSELLFLIRSWTDLIAYANYEYNMLCLILVPLRVKINLGPRPQNKILVPFRGRFQKIRRSPPSLLYGSPPPPPPGDKTKIHRNTTRIAFVNFLYRFWSYFVKFFFQYLYWISEKERKDLKKCLIENWILSRC